MQKDDDNKKLFLFFWKIFVCLNGNSAFQFFFFMLFRFFSFLNKKKKSKKKKTKENLGFFFFFWFGTFWDSRGVLAFIVCRVPHPPSKEKPHPLYGSGGAALATGHSRFQQNPDSHSIVCLCFSARCKWERGECVHVLWLCVIVFNVGCRQPKRRP